MIVYVDTGKHCGWTRATDEGALVDCGLGDPPPAGRGVLERPFIYPDGKQPVPPNNIVALAIEAGRVSVRYTQVEWVLPTTWKHNLPKAVVHRRGVSRLSEQELQTVKAYLPKTQHRHDVLDSVCLWLWKVGRL